MHYTSRGGLDERLHAAVDAGDVQEVDDILTSATSVNCFRDGVTPAGRAVRAGNAAMLSVILRHKPNLHLGLCTYNSEAGTCNTEAGTCNRGTEAGTNSGTDRCTVGTDTMHPAPHRDRPSRAEHKVQRLGERRVPLLLMAAEQGDAHIVRLLLQHGADPNESEDVRNCSALHVAAAGGHEEVVRELLRYEAYVDRLDLCSNTALHQAARRGYIGVTRLLLQEGAVVNLPGEDEVFLLHAASWDGDKDMVKLLLEHGALVYLQDCSGRTALHHAARAGRADITRLLLGAGGSAADWRADNGETALGAACEAGHVEVVRALLQSGQVDPGHVVGRGSAYRLPLQIAAAKGYVEIIRLLLHHGANINQRDPVHGETALHWAVRHHQMAAILELLQNEAKVNMADTVSGQTALHLACTLDTHGTFLDVTHLLVAHGANINRTQRRMRDTPLHIAARNGGKELVQQLMKQTTFSHCLNMQNAEGETPLMVAAHGGHCDVMDMLLHAGSQLMLTSLTGADSALHTAIRNQCYKAAMMLVRHGSEVNTENTAGETPLALLVDLTCNTGSVDTELVSLVNTMVFVGAKCGGKHDGVKSVNRQTAHHENADTSHTSQSNMVQHSTTSECLTAAMLASVQPLPLFRRSVAAVRGALLRGSGGISILPRIKHLPVPDLIKQNLALSCYYQPSSGS